MRDATSVETTEVPMTVLSMSDQANVRRMTDAVLSVHRDLRDLHEPCEQSFLAMGGQLAAARATGRTMVETAGRLAEMFNAAWLISAIRQLEQDINGLNRLLSDRGGQDAGLLRLDEAAAGIQTAVEGLRKLILHIQMLSINAKIEAALLSDLGLDFSVFTREISRLALRSGESTDAILAALVELRALVSQSMRLQNEFHTEHRKELDSISIRLTAAVGALYERQQTADEILGNLPRLLRDAEAAVAQVVLGLQIGDMTSQRMEHVEHALDTLAKVLGGKGADADMGRERSLLFINAICTLQEHQLIDIRDEFLSKTSLAAESLARLGTLVHDLQNGVHQLHGADKQRGRGFLLELERDLERTEGILDQYREARHETEISISKVGGMAEAMASSITAINDIDSEMHLIGLNASIKCGNLGPRGRSLNVVAAELQSFARQTRGTSSLIADYLNVITSGAEALNGGRNVDGTSLIDHLDSVLRSSISSLDKVGDNTARELATIQAEADQLLASIEATLARFTIRDRMAEVFTRGASILREIAEATAPTQAGEALEDARREMLAFLSSHYTMVSERDIHAAALAGENGERPSRRANSPSPATPAASFDIDDFLF